jgi:hypothetical protein
MSRVAALGLDDGDGEVAGVPEQVVGVFALAAPAGAAGHVDAAVGEEVLGGDGAGRGVPAGGLQPWHDIFAAGVGFVGHARAPPPVDWP